MNRIGKFKYEIEEKWATILWPCKRGMVGNEKETQLRGYLVLLAGDFKHEWRCNGLVS